LRRGGAITTETSAIANALRLSLKSLQLEFGFDPLELKFQGFLVLFDLRKTKCRLALER